LENEQKQHFRHFLLKLFSPNQAKRVYDKYPLFHEKHLYYPVDVFCKIKLMKPWRGLNKRGGVSLVRSSRLFLNFCFFFFKKKEKHAAFEYLNFVWQKI